MDKQIPNYILKGFPVWLLIIFAESIHGVARTLWLEPLIGDFRARQVSVFTGALIILTITYFLIRRIGAAEKAKLLKLGAFWVSLTVLFEICLGRFALNASWERIFSDYKIWEGGLMPIGLIFLFVTPLIAAKLQRLQ